MVSHFIPPGHSSLPKEVEEADALVSQMSYFLSRRMEVTLSTSKAMVSFLLNSVNNIGPKVRLDEFESHLPVIN